MSFWQKGKHQHNGQPWWCHVNEFGIAYELFLLTSHAHLNGNPPQYVLWDHSVRDPYDRVLHFFGKAEGITEKDLRYAEVLAKLD